MIYLILTILLNTYLGIVFKIFHKLGISVLQAIVINYWICVATGILFLQSNPFTTANLQQPFVGFALANGMAFFMVFYLISYCTNIFGISTTQISNKLSLVIPVFITIFLFQESLNALKIIGITLACVAVWLSSQKSNMVSNNALSKIIIVIPIVLFLSSGLLDSLANYIQKTYLHTNYLANIYIIFCFSAAAIAGSIYLAYQLFLGKQIIQAKAILAGIFLGIPNYFSIYTFIKALHSNILQSSAILPIINIAILLLSTLIAYVFFKENLSKKNTIGICLGVISILIIIFAESQSLT